MRIAEEVDPNSLSLILTQAGVVASERQVNLLVEHAHAVLSRNQELNLTRIVTPEGIMRLHVLDSAMLLRFLVKRPTGRLLDIGSGAGYPGIPLSILGEHTVTLAESVKKKAAFLSETCLSLGLPIEVKPLRAEELAEQETEAFDIVVARAVSSLPALVELAAPLLKRNGVLLAMKGQPDEEEFRLGDDAARLCGMSRTASDQYTLPGGDEGRTVVTYTRTRRPTVTLPRRPGMAQRHPLV